MKNFPLRGVGGDRFAHAWMILKVGECFTGAHVGRFPVARTVQVYALCLSAVCFQRGNKRFEW